jgi:hypothetical protein
MVDGLSAKSKTAVCRKVERQTAVAEWGWAAACHSVRCIAAGWRFAPLHLFDRDSNVKPDIMSTI